MPGSDGPRAAALTSVDLRSVNRRKHDHLLLRPRDGYIEPTLATREVQRPEVHCELAVFIRGVSDRKENHVALVPLDVLKVLDEIRPRPLLRQQLLQHGIRTSALVQHRPYQFLLRH